MKILKDIPTIIAIVLFVSSSMQGQVVIGTNTAAPNDNTIDDGAIFQVRSENQGLMIPNVSLNSRADLVTITATEVEGLMIYNTALGGTGIDRVSPGYYYFDEGENKWVRIFAEGYTRYFEQTTGLRAANQSTIYTIPNLDQDIVAPYTGTYQIYVLGHYSSTAALNMSSDAVGYASYMLEVDNIKVRESFLTSSTKNTGGQFQALSQQCTIIYNVDLIEGNTYNFRVRAREWAQHNMDIAGLDGIISGNFGFFGFDSQPYAGNTSRVPNAIKANMTITLLEQF